MFTLLDVWNDPTIRMLRAGTKFTVKALASAKAKYEIEKVKPSELAELMEDANAGNSNAQSLLGLHYFEQGDEGSAYYWLNRAARQGNEHAINILDSLQ